MTMMRYVNSMAAAKKAAKPFAEEDFLNMGNAAWSYWQTEALRSMSPVHTRWEVMDVVMYNLSQEKGLNPENRPDSLSTST